MNWLTAHGAQFHFDTEVVNVLSSTRATSSPVPRARNPRRSRRPSSPGPRTAPTRPSTLTENDLAFITNGSCVACSTFGSQTEPAAFDPTIKPGDCWDMWRKIAAQDPSFGKPDVFCTNPEQSNWMSATVTTLDGKIPPYIEKIMQAATPLAATL